MIESPPLPEMRAYKLFHEGMRALAQVEKDGVRIDRERLEQSSKETEEEIIRLTEELKKDDIVDIWRKRFGSKMNLRSRHQLSNILMKEIGVKTNAKTKKGNPKLDESVLEGLDLPFVKNYLKIEKLQKLKSTYLKAVETQIDDNNYLHFTFALNFAITYRSSSHDPNMQNIPVRNKMVSERIRSCFIPREGHVLLEVDYGALEFRIAACFWRDEAMVAYASNPNLDVHRDMASEIYLQEPHNVSKIARYSAKNKFVFPLLYGSYYLPCTINLWDAIDLENIEGMKEHLRSKGILEKGKCMRKEPPQKGSFEEHVKKCEENFKGMFPQWDIRKNQWWKNYLERGWFKLPTGFICQGVYSKNQLMNTPIQGSAFHCLLWSLIEIVKYLKTNKMKSCVVGQIHDSIILDVHKKEFDDVIQKVVKTMTDDLRKEFTWVITPMEVEAEIAETCWYEKKAIEL